MPVSRERTLLSRALPTAGGPALQTLFAHRVDGRDNETRRHTPNAVDVGDSPRAGRKRMTVEPLSVGVGGALGAGDRVVALVAVG